MAEWSDWLGALRAAGKGPVTSTDGWPSATRGLAWSHAIQLEGDWTGAALEGSIRSAPDSGGTLASFTVTGPVVADGQSTFTVSLSAGEVSALPADGDLNGVVELPMMIRLTPSGGTKDLLFGGIFTVVGLV